mmetsp:Transcript_18089/g.52418  ORF Transcript_18089/g.52418 Transcript_18089/m.52418 type:complete len:221 (+) Transcript_18089:207-869(+)
MQLEVCDPLLCLVVDIRSWQAARGGDHSLLRERHEIAWGRGREAHHAPLQALVDRGDEGGAHGRQHGAEFRSCRLPSAAGLLGAADSVRLAQREGGGRQDPVLSGCEHDFAWGQPDLPTARRRDLLEQRLPRGSRPVKSLRTKDRVRRRRVRGSGRHRGELASGGRARLGTVRAPARTRAVACALALVDASTDVGGLLDVGGPRPLAPAHLPWRQLERES